MSNFTLPTAEGNLIAFFNNFSTAMDAYSAVLGFDAGDEAACKDAYDDFLADFNAAETAKAAYRGAVSTKSKQRKTSSDIVRDYAQQIKNNPAATPEILTAFGISTTPAGSGPVVTPTNFTPNPSANGICKLTWNKAGNAAGTTYVIEHSANGSSWNFLGTTTAAKFTDTNATAGVARYYRIRAARSGNNSPWSSTIAIYLGGSSLSLAA